jgi:hypothetical protein
MSRFPEQHDPKGVVELRIGEHHTFDGHVSECCGSLSGRKATQLFADVWRRVEKKPVVAVAADGG